MERWTYNRKADVVAAIRTGKITFDEACQRYDLSAEELRSWQRMLARYGREGLKVTKLRQYR